MGAYGASHRRLSPSDALRQSGVPGLRAHPLRGDLLSNSNWKTSETAVPNETCFEFTSSGQKTNSQETLAQMLKAHHT